MDTKQIQLRAFAIAHPNTTLSCPNQNIVNMLKNELKTNKRSAKDRIMLLNHDDPQKISDALPFYEERKDCVFGLIMRISNDENVQHIPSTLLNKEKFSIAEMKKSRIDNSSIYRSHYYFLLNEKFLVTSLKMNTTISGFQTYMNWLLGDTHFSFTTIVDEPPDLKLDDLKKITISDFIDDTSSVECKKFDISSIKDWVIDTLFKENQTFDEIKMKQILSAQLLLKFIKPKSMTKEDFKTQLGVCLNPISDLGNFAFEKKDGRKITAEKILKTKAICVEKTENGFISEQNLFNEMNMFLSELK